ncbi:MAG: prepilin-type N-terminal cleavage/methylation domain-containing protein [Chloroflexi bacterium]|nr:prepilin-type N-terminal cleavage/methylation domain-containing protein [Chloroflexota bacterium]
MASNVHSSKIAKGFTLVELMVVMAILGVLAAIVTPAVSGTKQVSKDSQVKSDATSVQNGLGAYNTDANTAELLTTTTENILAVSTTMVISNHWPEQNINDGYGAEFPASVGTAANSVAELVFVGAKKYDGTAISTAKDFAETYNSVVLTTLTGGGYLAEKPQGADNLFSSAKQYHNYLWLAKKIPAGSDTDGGRALEVFKLTKIEASTVSGSESADKLTYERIF